MEVNGAAVPLFGIFNFGSYQQINFQLPFDLANGFATLDVVNNGVKSLVFSFPVFRIPEVFTVGETGMAAAQHADGSPVSPASPARGGETIMVYATGLGATDPPIQAGIVTPSTPLFHTVGQVSAILGGISAPVTFSGLTPGSVGLFQINLQVPLGVSGNANLIVSFPEGNRSKAVQIPVQ